jgi:hypothetical protein
MCEILLPVHFHNHSIKKLQIPFKQNILNLSLGYIDCIFYIFCGKMIYLSSSRVNDKTIIFIMLFIYLLLYIK